MKVKDKKCIVPYYLLAQRIRRGWNTEQALITNKQIKEKLN